jgi:hypothetical protein
MSTKQSDEKEGNKYATTQACKAAKQSDEKEGNEYATTAKTQACKASQEALLRGDMYFPWSECPVCWRSHGVKCLIGDHRSDKPTGNKNNGVDALNLFVPVYLSSHSPLRCLL